MLVPLRLDVRHLRLDVRHACLDLKNPMLEMDEIHVDDKVNLVLLEKRPPNALPEKPTKFEKPPLIKK